MFINYLFSRQWGRGLLGSGLGLEESFCCLRGNGEAVRGRLVMLDTTAVAAAREAEQEEEEQLTNVRKSSFFSKQLLTNFASGGAAPLGTEEEGSGGEEEVVSRGMEAEMGERRR